jgi:uncharacterized protein YcbK (DUF882 family)
LKTSVASVLLWSARVLSPTPIRAEAAALPEGELSFYNVHTDERLRVRYRDERGRYDLSALDDLNHILRCHHTGEVAAMDPRVIEHLNLVQKTLGGEGEIHVISGYRSPDYNAIGPPGIVCMSRARPSTFSFPAYGRVRSNRLP